MQWDYIFLSLYLFVSNGWSVVLWAIHFKHGIYFEIKSKKYIFFSTLFHMVKEETKTSSCKQVNSGWTKKPKKRICHKLHYAYVRRIFHVSTCIDTATYFKSFSFLSSFQICFIIRLHDWKQTNCYRTKNTIFRLHRTKKKNWLKVLEP